MPRQCLQHLFPKIIVLVIFVLSAHCQSIVTDYTPYQALPTTPLPAANNSGMFLWPLTGSVELYEVGSMMNISWSSKFSRTNLWLVPNFDWSYPVALLADTSSTNYEWTVQCLGDCKVPWLVRATDAEGGSDAQMNGGFVSAEFWIMPVEDNNSTIPDASASGSIGMHTTTLIKSTITVSPSRLTVTLDGTSSRPTATLNGTSSTTSIKGTGVAKATTTTFKMPANSTTHSTTRPASPTTSQATFSETPSPSPTRESGSPVLGSTANHGIIFGVIFGAVIGWYF